MMSAQSSPRSSRERIRREETALRSAWSWVSTHQGSAPRLGESVGLGEGEGEGEGLADGDGLGEGDGDGEWEGLGEGFGVGLGLDLLALGDEPVGVEVDGDGSAPISRPKVGGRIMLGAGDKLGLAGERVSACISGAGDDEGTWMVVDGAKEGGESAKSSVPIVAWE
jgi:hypothetical protein